jgi:chloramphenicol 3-O phosphotransferase
VGVRCPIEIIMQRRDTVQEGREGVYVTSTPDESISLPVQRWQSAVHQPGTYDLEVDTSQLTPAECAEEIQNHLRSGRVASAFVELANDSKSDSL